MSETPRVEVLRMPELPPEVVAFIEQRRYEIGQVERILHPRIADRWAQSISKVFRVPTAMMGVTTRAQNRRAAKRLIREEVNRRARSR